MKRIDMETILLCAIMAVAGAFGMIAGGAAFAGVRFQECNAVLLAGGGCGLGGILWGILLIFNSNMVSKRG
ncbi:MAG: hypothetical protein PUJ55_02585 [Clostridiales bacterium]|nr:hypothetical protein [Roseburia sp.]MDD7635809.1 hypothetical protein [Clostridiales bacterium]MDY4111263.1 hypothetical protein [Roseburia sp.]